MVDRLDDSNFILYCAKHYDNPHCHDTEEFYEDLRRIKYIKKLIETGLYVSMRERVKYK